MISLEDLYDYTTQPIAGAVAFLYELMKQRPPEANISHGKLPAFGEHEAFVNRHPYRYWYLIKSIAPIHMSCPDEWVGYISATQSNEIGIVLLERFRGRGFGPIALRMFIANHHPLDGQPSQRSGQWIANIAPENEHSKHIFTKLGFSKVQETYKLKEEHVSQSTQGIYKNAGANAEAG